jgi:putative glutamine amidotransferase
MKARPWIGITMRLELATRRFYLGRDYSEAVDGFGGIPLHLALIPKREFISAALDGLDGILLPGSDSDVDPARFNEEPHPALGTVVPEKDETDLLVLEEAEKRNLPVLAICYGMQSLNVSRGGSLIQDIRSQVEDCLKHEQGKPVDRMCHGVSFESGSLLEKFSESAGIDPTLRVNSHHHQSVREAGRDLVITARAKDGIVECIEDTRENRSVIGVQWHPEINWQNDLLSRQIFDWFIHECEARMGKTAKSNNEKELGVLA